MYLIEPNLLLILKLSPHSVNSTSSFINHPKKRVANPLTALINFLKSPSYLTHKTVFYAIGGVNYIAENAKPNLSRNSKVGN
jgi:hypothetical protein